VSIGLHRPLFIGFGSSGPGVAVKRAGHVYRTVGENDGLEAQEHLGPAFDYPCPLHSGDLALHVGAWRYHGDVVDDDRECGLTVDVVAGVGALGVDRILKREQHLGAGRNGLGGPLA
jgi:hypothetical protein